MLFRGTSRGHGPQRAVFPIANKLHMKKTIKAPQSPALDPTLMLLGISSITAERVPLMTPQSFYPQSLV